MELLFLFFLLWLFGCLGTGRVAPIYYLRQSLRQPLAALALAVSLAGAGVISQRAVVADVIDWCEADWVKESAFWRWYFNCDSKGGAPPLAPKEETPAIEAPK